MYDYVDSSFKNVFLVISCKKLEAENILNQISCIQRISVYKNRRTENSKILWTISFFVKHLNFNKFGIYLNIFFLFPKFMLQGLASFA